MTPLTRKVYSRIVRKVSNPYLTIARLSDEYRKIEGCDGREQEERREGFKLALMNIVASEYSCSIRRREILSAPLKAK